MCALTQQWSLNANFQVLAALIAQMTEGYYTMQLRKAIVYTYSIRKCIVWCYVLF